MNKLGYDSQHEPFTYQAWRHFTNMRIQYSKIFMISGWIYFFILAIWCPRYSLKDNGHASTRGSGVINILLVLLYVCTVYRWSDQDTGLVLSLVLGQARRKHSIAASTLTCLTDLICLVFWCTLVLFRFATYVCIYTIHYIHNM